MKTTEKTYVVHVTATDNYGKESSSIIPVKSHTTLTEAAVIDLLNRQYPHLRHRIDSLNELKSPEQVEDWHHSFMGTIFGEDIPLKEEKDEE